MENAIMKTLLSTVAVVALLAGAPAFAADNATPADQAAPATPDQTKTDMMKKAPAAAEAPAATDQNKAAEAPAPTDQPKAAAAPAPTDQTKAAAATPAQPKFVTQQTDQERLVSKIIGKTIYNSGNENIGSVSDLVIGQNGQVDTVIVGVGGFLGIGEKMVGIPFTAIQVSNDQDGNVKLTAQLSKDDLNKAPEFMTLADIKAKAQEKTQAPAPAPAQ
jgi:sporulation protein YlmC with PRC-barrel domain